MRNPFKTLITQEQPVVEDEAPRPDDKEAGVLDSKEAGLTTERRLSSEPETDADSIDKDAQAGVQKIEAITKVWTTRDLYLAYILYARPESQFCSS